MSGHESCSFGSEYILNRILRLQARLLVSCFNKLGFDLPLNPESRKQQLLKQMTQKWTRLRFYPPDNTLLISFSISNCLMQTYCEALGLPPALQRAVLCSLLELKSLAKLCDSSRQSSSLKRCADVMWGYMP